MKSLTLLLVALFTVLTFGTACSAPDNVTGVKVVGVADVYGVPTSDVTTTTDDYWLHLVGAGVINSPCEAGVWDCTNGTTPDVVIEALRKFDGTVNGWVHLPGYQGALGPGGSPRDFPVVALVAPNATYNHWCVEVQADYDHSIHIMFYVRDWPDGDQVALGGNFVADGGTCALQPAPFDYQEWFPVTGGDYKGLAKSR